MRISASNGSRSDVVPLPEADEPRPDVVLAPEIELRGREAEDPCGRSRRELGDGPDPPERACVDAEAHEIADVGVEALTRLGDPLPEQ